MHFYQHSNQDRKGARDIMASQQARVARHFPAPLMQFFNNVAETWLASAKVIENRSRLLHAASHDPLSADFAELGRMIPEKVDALTRSVVAGARAASALHAEVWNSWEAGMQILARGAPPAPKEVDAFMAHFTRMGDIALSTGDLMLEPVRQRVNSNVRRLAKGSGQTGGD